MNLNYIREVLNHYLPDDCTLTGIEQVRDHYAVHIESSGKSYCFHFPPLPASASSNFDYWQGNALVIDRQLHQSDFPVVRSSGMTRAREFSERLAYEQRLMNK